MSRRGLLRSLLAVVGAAPALVLVGTVRAAQAAPFAGSATVTANAEKWTRLPGAGGIEVHLSDSTRRAPAVAVAWTADGRVTATWAVPVTCDAPTSTGGQRVAVGPGVAVAVRRVAG